jgi:hypothetical protein
MGKRKSATKVSQGVPSNNKKKPRDFAKGDVYEAEDSDPEEERKQGQRYDVS